MPTLTCPQCNQDQAIIEQQQDSFTKVVHCLACQYTCLLKHYNHLTHNNKPK